MGLEVKIAYFYKKWHMVSKKEINKIEQWTNFSSIINIYDLTYLWFYVEGECFRLGQSSNVLLFGLRHHHHFLGFKKRQKKAERRKERDSKESKKLLDKKMTVISAGESKTLKFWMWLISWWLIHHLWQSVPKSWTDEPCLSGNGRSL
jgi:hypothetical protein